MYNTSEAQRVICEEETYGIVEDNHLFNKTLSAHIIGMIHIVSLKRETIYTAEVKSLHSGGYMECCIHKQMETFLVWLSLSYPSLEQGTIAMQEAYINSFQVTIFLCREQQ